MQKTTLVKNKDIQKTWHQVDAAGQVLGRLATQVARLLIGKNKVTYSNHQDVGDFVVIKNAAKAKFASRVKKLEQKKYYSYSGYPGGLRTKTLGEKVKTSPEDVIRGAVREMIDDNRLRKLRMRRLKVVSGDSHNFPIKK